MILTVKPGCRDVARSRRCRRTARVSVDDAEKGLPMAIWRAHPHGERWPDRDLKMKPPNTCQPSARQEIDLLRPVSRRPGPRTPRVARSFSAVFVSRAGAARRCPHPTPIEALGLRMANGGRQRTARGLETQSYPRPGLLMTSDVAAARPSSPGSGEGRRIERVRGAEWKEAGVPSTRRVAGSVIQDRRRRGDAHRCGRSPRVRSRDPS